MRRGAPAAASDRAAETRDALAALDARLFALWNLGDNVLLGWTRSGANLVFLSVRHYAIAESVYAGPDGGALPEAWRFINEILSGPKHLEPAQFERVCSAFHAQRVALRFDLREESDGIAELISGLVRRYGVSLVRSRAVLLLDAVEFSLRTPLDQMAMLNSLAYSVNSAYAQLLLKDIKIDFARTTTGDGFYIWNRAITAEGNIELYKLMMMILADNAVAQRKARSSWVPKLRAAFHLGEHYEFHQVEGVNPTHFSYIVGQVTVDLSRMLERALPGQILLGDFTTTPDFVGHTAATLEQLHGLNISGGRISNIRCYLTGPDMGGGHYRVNRYHLRDKHGTTRTVYNAKINIHRDGAEPIFLGIRTDDLWAFNSFKVESLR